MKADFQLRRRFSTAPMKTIGILLLAVCTSVAALWLVEPLTNARMPDATISAFATMAAIPQVQDTSVPAASSVRIDDEPVDPDRVPTTF